jgi:hypothetical protein
MSKADPTSTEAVDSSFSDEILCIDDETKISKPPEEEISQVISDSIPVAPIPIIYNTVSGRYRSQDVGFQLELRVDVDGRRRMNRLSGDFYSVSGGTTTYFGSLVVDSVSMTVTPSLVTVQGLGRYTWAAGAPVLRVTIPRTRIFQRRSPATAQFLTASGSPGASYVCPFVSVYFRTVQYELDRVSDVTTPVFASYNTGSLPSGCPGRTLSVPGAYAEAGIEMQTAGIWDVVPVAEAGSNVKWSDSELHASMVKHFSLWADSPQWKVWQLAAQSHEIGPGLYGIMFDQQGKQRQGCAVFHNGIGGTTSDKLRLQLYTYVHELGHCFNLLHSWQKSYAQPPTPNRPDSLSWMNYPWNYPDGGAATFWSRFCFQFDDLEVIHLRHAFRNNVIMGGNPFIVGSAVEDPEAFSNPIEDNSGLRLELRAKGSFALGEPVVVEIKLATTDTRGVQVVKYLHPNEGFVQIGIKKPSGEVAVYEPLMEHCIAEGVTTLNDKQPSIYESAFISYGKGGQYFDQIGAYQLRALYYAPGGSLVFSDVINLRVRSPHSDTDEEVADLLLGDEQGTLLYLLGSDSEFLKKGNEAFEKVLKDYPDHPLAVYPQLVKGFNAGRAFKTITEDKVLTVRQPRYSEAISLLSSVVDVSERGQGVDNITLDTTMIRMANNQKTSGDSKGAKETAERMLDIFSKKSLRPHIMQLIEEQARKIKEKKG